MTTPHLITVGGAAGAAVVGAELIVAQTLSIDPATLIGIGTLITLFFTALGGLAGAWVAIRNSIAVNKREAATAAALIEQAEVKATDDRRIAAEDRQIAAEERAAVKAHLQTVTGATKVISSQLDGTASALREIAVAKDAKIEALEQKIVAMTTQAAKDELREKLLAQSAARPAGPIAVVNGTAAHAESDVQPSAASTQNAAAAMIATSLKNIDENTEQTAKNTARTEATVQELKDLT